MEQLNSNIERVIEANSTIEVFNTGAFYALVRAYKYVVVDNNPVKEKINVPFSFDLYDKDNEKISTGTISPGEKATFKVPTYKMVINNTYAYEVHIVYSFGSGTVSQLKTDLELTTEDIAALTQYDRRDFLLLSSIDGHIFENLETLSAINATLTAQTAVDKTPVLLQKYPIFISLEGTNTNITYFNAIDLNLEYSGGGPQRHFVTHIDISFDYSQANGYNRTLWVTNTFNPAMSFGQYSKLKDLTPDTKTHWNSLKWTERANDDLPTRSKSLVIDNGKVLDDGHFRIEINESYGDASFFNIENFILRTDIVQKSGFSGGARKVTLRKYTATPIKAPADITQKVLSGTYNFADYNKCAIQEPITSTGSVMLLVDICIYGHLFPNP